MRPSKEWIHSYSVFTGSYSAPTLRGLEKDLEHTKEPERELEEGEEEPKLKKKKKQKK